MIYQLTKLLRERLHPLYNLRKSKFFVYQIMPIIDMPVWCNIHGVKWKVRVRFVRHLPYILNSRILEPGIASLFVAIQKIFRPAAFWDIGANIGFYSWLMLSLDESVQAVLFEPDLDQAALIADTISHSDIPNAQLMRYAVSDTTGKAEFAVDKASGATGSLATDTTFNERLFGWKPECITVETISIDDACFLQHLPKPDLIKIDVEMSEHLAFRGAQKLLAEAQPVIIFECSSSNKVECLATLRLLNYQIFNADEANSELDSAINFLALPAAQQQQWDELLDRWQTERKEWDK